MVLISIFQVYILGFRLQFEEFSAISNFKRDLSVTHPTHVKSLFHWDLCWGQGDPGYPVMVPALEEFLVL